MRRSSTVHTTEDHVLRGHTIHKQQRCMSFNYQNIENGDCELNKEATDASIHGALTTQRGYTFGQFVNLSVSST